MPYSLEQKFKALCQITRAAHFEWRQTFIAMNPGADPKEAVLKYWEIVGHDTAKAYIKQIDPQKPIVPQLAKAIVDSSLAMGETARIIPGGSDNELHFEHQDCPWLKWHQRYDAADEDRPGCDKWLETLINDISKEFGVKLIFETLSSLPDGQDTCERVLRQVD